MHETSEYCPYYTEAAILYCILAWHNNSYNPRMCVLSPFCGNVDKHGPFDISYIYIYEYIYISIMRKKHL